MKLVLIWSFLLLVGCGESKEDEEEASTLFSGEGQVTSWTQYNGQTASLLESMQLTPSDFNNLEDKYTGATAENIEQNFDYQYREFKAQETGAASIHMLTGVSFAGYNYYYGESDSEEVRDCINALLGESAIKTLKSEYRFDVDIVLTPCFAPNVPETHSKFSATMKASFYGQCDQADLGPMDGMTYAEIATEEAYALSPFCRQQTSYASAVVYKESYTYTSGETTFDRVYTVKSATYDGNGRSCQKKRNGDEVYFEDGCVYYYNQNIDYDFGTSTSQSGNFFTYTSRGLVQELGDHDWYKSGAMDVTFGEWTGAVTYNGSDTAPTWKLSKGSASITGDFEQDDE